MKGTYANTAAPANSRSPKRGSMQLNAVRQENSGASENSNSAKREDIQVNRNVKETTGISENPHLSKHGRLQINSDFQENEDAQGSQGSGMFPWNVKKINMVNSITHVSSIIGQQDIVVYSERYSSDAPELVLKVNSGIFRDAGSIIPEQLKQQPGTTYETRFTSISFDAFLCICWYMYHGVVVTPTLPVSLEQYKLASSFQVKDVVEKLKTFLLKIELPVSLLYDVLLESKRVGFERLTTRILRLIAQHPVEFVALFGTDSTFGEAAKYTMLSSSTPDFAITVFEQLFLEINLTPSIVCSMLEVAETFKMLDLRKKCLRLISRETREVLASDDFSYATRRVIQDILKLDVLSISAEIELLIGVVVWSYNQMGRGKEEKQMKDSSDILKSFLPCIRFLAMTAHESKLALSFLSELMSPHDQELICKMIEERNVTPSTQSYNTKDSRLFRMPSSSGRYKIFRLNLTHKTDNPYTHIGKKAEVLRSSLMFRMNIVSRYCHVVFYGFKIDLVVDESCPSNDRSWEFEVSYTSSNSSLGSDATRICGYSTIKIELSVPVRLKIDDRIEVVITLRDVRGFTLPFLKKSQQWMVVNQGCSPHFGITCDSSYTFKNSKAFVISEIFYKV